MGFGEGMKEGRGRKGEKKEGREERRGRGRKGKKGRKREVKKRKGRKKETYIFSLKF